MSNNDGYWDFAAFWEFFNPYDDKDKKSINCPVCGREFDETDEIEMVDIESKVFKCPECGRKIEFDEDLKALVEVEEEEVSFTCGRLASLPKYVNHGIAFYLDLITLELKGESKEAIIKEIVSMFTRAGIVKDGSDFYKALLNTESAFGSTALGEGLAFPYGYAEFNENVPEKIVVAVAVSKVGIDFKSLDGQLTKAIFMAAYYADTNTSFHIKPFARISKFIATSGFRKFLLEANCREEIFEYIKENFKDHE